MQFTEEQLKKIHELGGDWFFRLYIKKYFPESKLWEEEDNHLLLKKYLNTNYSINKNGEEVLQEILGKEVSKKVDNMFYVELHKKLVTELKTLTGKSQKMLNSKYPLICNSQDLESKLSKVVKRYKITDLKLVEKQLVNYIYKCYKADFQFVQTVAYYIEKNGISNLVSDLGNIEEKEEVKIVENINTKELF